MAQQKQEQDLNQLLKVRRDKLADLQANGKDPFQITKFNQTHHSMEVKSLYEAHEAELLKDRAEVDVTGLDEEQAKEAVKKAPAKKPAPQPAKPIISYGGFTPKTNTAQSTQASGSKIHKPSNSYTPRPVGSSVGIGAAKPSFGLNS